MTLVAHLPILDLEELGHSTFMRMDAPFDAAQECDTHGRLPTDRSPACGCFPGLETRKPKRVPDLMTTLKRAEEAVLNTQDQTDPEAPWGRKSDGSPRAKPGRKPKVAACSSAAPCDRVAECADEGLTPVGVDQGVGVYGPEVRPTLAVVPDPAVPPTGVSEDPVLVAIDSLTDRLKVVNDRVATIEAEVTRLEGLRDELGEAEELARKLTDAVESLELIADEPAELLAAAA